MPQELLQRVPPELQLWKVELSAVALSLAQRLEERLSQLHVKSEAEGLSFRVLVQEQLVSRETEPVSRSSLELMQVQ